MDKEVELILSKLKIVSEEQERGMYLCDKEHSKLLLDYIANLQQENEKKDAYIKYLEEYNPKYYKGEKFYGDGREDYKLRCEKAVEYIEKNLLPSHSIEKTDWEFEEVIYSDLPVEVIKPLIDILNGKE